MRWFGGFCEHAPEAGRAPASPPGAERLWSGAVSLWLAGDWPSDEVRLVRLPGRQLALLGCCYVSAGELEAALRGSSSAHGNPRLVSWPGSYHLVVEDADGVAVYGDLAGARPVFYATGPDGLRFASAALPLSVSLDTGVDQTWLAVTLLCPSVPELVADRSPFAGIAAVAPGHALCVSRTQSRTRPVWSPCPGRRTLAEGAEALRAALTAAIGARVAHAERLTSDLSGGLDSSSVAWLAASALPEGSRLRAVTLDEAIVGNDDLPFARMVAERHPRIEHHVVAVPDAALPYSNLADVTLTDEPCPSLPTVARFQWWMASIAAFGSDGHLTGHGGDAVLLAPPPYLADLRSGRDLARHCLAWARLRHRPSRALTAAARAAARTDRRQAFRQLADVLLADPATTTAEPFEQRIGWPSSPAPLGWFTRQARSIVAERLREAAETRKPVSGGLGDLAALGDLHRLARMSRTDTQVAEQLGVRLHDPFLDNTVVQACLDVPAAQRTSPFVVKPLLQHAMAGLVPAALLDRRAKGNYTPTAHRGAAHNTLALRELLADGLLVGDGILDRAAAHKAVDDARRLPVPFAAFDGVVSAELWLRALSCGRPTVRPGGAGAGPCVG